MLSKKLLSLPFALLAIFSLVFSGCGTGPDGGGTGTMTVEMTDAPIDSADAVNVFIERVEVQSQDGSGWITLNEPQKEYNLLELTNGATAVIGSKELEEGTYSQIRLVLSQDGHSVVVDGNEYSMKVPSGPQTGIKLNVNAEIKPDIEYTLLLDFEASESVVKAGQSGKYLLKPVIRAKEKAITGNIAGTVNPADAKPVVYAIDNSDTMATTVADTSSGDFKLIGLEDGTYDVSFKPRADGYQTKTVEGVEVTVEQTNDIGTVDISSN